MAKRVRTVARGAGLVEPSVSSRALLSKPSDPRQPELFGPVFIPPCKPKLAKRVPRGELWQYEIKHDGYRLQAHVTGQGVTLFTKTGHDWTDRLPGLVASLEALQVGSAILDGEAVMEDDSGISDFFALHAALARRSAPDAILYAFDLLELDGADLRSLPLSERRAILAEILVGAPPGIELSPHLDDGGEQMLRHACEFGLEGIVAKRKDAPYRSGYVDTWLKVKCTTKESFAVVGCEKVGRSGLRTLQVATLKDGKLVPAGWVGTGLTGPVCKEIRAALDAGEPVVIDVEFRGWTPAGELRHAVFKGWHGG
jgi:bifunctional non-homologous end joining protein LigD